MIKKIIAIAILALSVEASALVGNCSYTKTIGTVSTSSSGFAPKFKALKAACANYANSEIVYSASGMYMCQVGYMCSMH